YYLDQGILAALGKDFVKVGENMRAEVERGKAAPVIEEMKRAGAGFRAIDNLETAREIAGSVSGEAEQAPQTAGGERFALRNDSGFCSVLKRAAERLTQERGTAAQFLAMLRNQPGVKAEELEWTGLEEYLRAQGQEKVTKQAIVEFLDANGVRVEE